MAMSHDAARRVATNEAFFRSLNEQIANAARRLHGDATGDMLYSMMCECAVFNCPQMVSATLEEYETVRDQDRRFMVFPAHVAEGAERVVDRLERYWVVEKDGLVGELARALV